MVGTGSFVMCVFSCEWGGLVGKIKDVSDR